MKIQTIPLKDLKLAKYNPRVIGEAEMAGLIESFKTFDQVETLVINSDMTVISGHQRILVMERLGIEEAVCNIVDLDKKQEKKLNLVLNSNAISGSYHEVKLAEILNELRLDEDFGALRLDKLDAINLQDMSPEEEWVGMPEFNQDNLMPHRQLIISFKNDADVEAFARLVKQPITDKTRSIWYPLVPRLAQADREYANET